MLQKQYNFGEHKTIISNIYDGMCFERCIGKVQGRETVTTQMYFYTLKDEVDYEQANMISKFKLNPM